MNKYTKILSLVGVSLLLSTTHLLATEKSALNILNKAFESTGNMDKYAFTAVIIDSETLEDGSIVPHRYDTSVKVDRPGNLRVNTKSEFLDRSNYINDGLYTIIEHGHGYYGQLTVPKDLDKALDSIFTNYNIKARLASLIYSDMSKRVKFKSSKYFGTTTINGIACNYVAFKSKVQEVHVWITTGDTPLVKAYSIIDTTKQPHSRINTTITWIKNPNISDSDFIFHAPKGSQQISVLTAN